MRGDGTRYGKNTGMTRGQFLVALFDKQMTAKLTDEELVNAIQEEFPGVSTPYERYISMYRNRYNRGGFGPQRSPPSVPIPRFGEDRKVLPQKSGPEPRYAWEEKKRRSDG